MAMRSDPLSARNLARYGLRRGAYDGANRRRFVLFKSVGIGVKMRTEIATVFDTQRELDAATLKAVRRAMQVKR